MSGLDWPGLMRAGLCELRLRPRDFWALTPAELELMLGRDAAMPTMNRAGLEALARRFPDRMKEAGDD
ncbi:rcc01693 family protein [Mangrovicoccus algicola]|uniref:Phage tail assembly chaperone n=1 Tax=Mangrovicoccus algicola TaxID=2771008 RepID=A0A8J7CWD5_9RHOB|nr:rcc01693 family protein [Mangrovicoccus algicola]MBE3639734.1 phage tail assembly chaperone [Mangrovicoccus algicola]